MNIALTAKSSNAKIGPMPSTTSSKLTCPPSCPLIGNGCYASAGFFTRVHWDKVSSGERGTDIDGFTAKIAKLKPDTIWRHNVAGDLIGSDDVIDREALQAITLANTGKRGFTYTHYPLSKPGNLESLIEANNGGFTVNASCNSPQEALDLHKTTSLPLVSIVPSDYWAKGNKRGPIVRCPAEYKDTNCKECKLCQRGDRSVIVGFTVHGTQSKSADVIARG